MSAEKNMQWFWDSLDSYLSRKVLKQTKQRKVIVGHFLRLNDHVDAEELYGVVRKAGHNIGLATIYRTLNLLKDAGLVEQSSSTDGRAVFELLRPGAHHDHLHCIRCGKIVEFENDEIEGLQREVAKKYGFVLTSHRLDLFGHCPKCAKS